MSPQSAVKGDLRKTFANPTPIALIGYILALTPLSCDYMVGIVKLYKDLSLTLLLGTAWRWCWHGMGRYRYLLVFRRWTDVTEWNSGVYPRYIYFQPFQGYEIDIMQETRSQVLCLLLMEHTGSHMPPLAHLRSIQLAQ